jgi:hypothetical protein
MEESHHYKVEAGCNPVRSVRSANSGKPQPNCYISWRVFSTLSFIQYTGLSFVFEKGTSTRKNDNTSKKF